LFFEGFRVRRSGRRVRKREEEDERRGKNERRKRFYGCRRNYLKREESRKLMWKGREEGGSRWEGKKGFWLPQAKMLVFTFTV